MWPNKLSVAVLLAGFTSIGLVSALDVGETSNHQDMLLPFGNAYEEFRKEGCLSITRKKLSPVTQYKVDIDTIVITGQVVRITCKRPDPAPTEVVEAVAIEVSWSAPTERENGDNLPPDQISHYEIHIDDKTYTSENSPWRIDIVPGIYYISMLAIDTDGLRSALTNPVQVTAIGE